MDYYQAILLALIQGVTEFLPISSSGHLLLPAKFFGWPDQTLTFDVAVHIGSLLAVVIYLRKELKELFTAWIHSIFFRAWSVQSFLAWQLVIATIPAALCGWFFSEFIENNLREVVVIAAATTFFGIILGVADFWRKKSKTLEDLGWGDVFVIGVSQALALIPGTSRSGITMTSALFLGYSREDAARFSFLMSVPIISLSGMYKGSHLIVSQTIDWEPLILGVFVSSISAYVCIYSFLRFIQKIGMLPFVIYRICLGLILFMIAYLY